MSFFVIFEDGIVMEATKITITDGNIVLVQTSEGSILTEFTTTLEISDKDPR